MEDEGLNWSLSSQTLVKAIYLLNWSSIPRAKSGWEKAQDQFLPQG